MPNLSSLNKHKSNYILDDAFEKWGHMDAAACNQITTPVIGLIESLGYQVTADSWGSHNYVIMEIARGTEIVYPIDGYRIGGYDTRHYSAVLPDDILEILEQSQWNWNDDNGRRVMREMLAGNFP